MILHVAAFVAAGFLTRCASAQLSPQEALAHMKVADGFEVTLFASEPEVWNPTSMDVDARGRVWIAEAVNYRLFNQPRTTELGDRIRILEDTDGDGKCDKATTYFQDPQLQAPMGIAVLGNRVYICQSPDLFYLEDTDGDGHADKRTVILTGFGGIDNDHGIHGVNWAADGHLYISNGDQGLDVTDKNGNRVHAGKDAPLMAATVLRTDLEGNRLDWLAQSMRNPYEPAVDSFGNVFISDNDDDGNENTRINYVMEGGNYGYWPKRKGDRRLEAVHWNADRPGVVPRMIRTGFGSPCGLMVYEGRGLPERVWGALIHAEAGPGEIRAFRMKPDGAGFSAEKEVLLRCEGDSWFRPVDVAAAPDGSLFVADWYDPGVGGHRMGDITRGRVYRLAEKGAAYSRLPLDLDSDAGLREAFGSPNAARRYLAWDALNTRLAKGDTKLLEQIMQDRDAVMRARALWLLARDPKRGPAAIDAAAKSELAADRVQATRVIAAADPKALLAHPKLLADDSPMVRRQILVELARAQLDAKMDAAAIELALRYDGVDRFYREAAGIALRGSEDKAWDAIIAKAGPTWDARLAGLAIQLHPAAAAGPAREAVNHRSLPADLRNLALQALDAIGSPDAGAEIATHVSNAESPEVAAYALTLLSRDGGDVWRATVDQSGVDAYLRGRLTDPAARAGAIAFIGDARRAAFVPDLLQAALDASRPIDERVTLLTIAGRMTRRENTPQNVLERLINDEQGRIGVEALGILARFRDDPARDQLHALVLDAGRLQGLRRNAARLLGESKSGAMSLLKSAESGTLAADIEFDVGEVLRSSRFDDVRMFAGQILPPEKTRDGRPLPTVAELVKMAGDSVRGRAVFFSEDRSQCYQCHRIASEGRKVGPDLSKIGEKYGKDGLLESILNPSAAISHEFEVWVVETRGHDVLTGYLRKDAPEGIELVDSTGNVVTIPAGDIVDRYTSAMSLMPNGLAAGMTTQELVDVVAFLALLK
jgi:putative membrane-bound dehydrogenase-like protein